MNRICTVVLLLAGMCLLFGSSWSQNDPVGKIDTVTIVVEPLDEDSWVITTHVWNDEELGGFGIPLKYTAGVAALNVDSVSYEGTKTKEYFELFYQVDTANQMIHFGGVTRMAAGPPPMPAGGGTMGRIFVSALGDKKPGPFAVDTVTMKPNNKLMLVDKNAKSIWPALKIVYPEKGKEEKAKKEK
jgi:hypothetical protein